MKKNKHILIGVCAGIAAYKACELVRALVKDGYSVKVVMTPSAEKFVTPLVFQTLTGNQVYSDMFALHEGGGVEHISLAEWADACVIAPLTANTLSKLACGICDNLLTTIVCALPAGLPVILVPAMNSAMWHHPRIQENTRRLEKISGYCVLTPAAGLLACGAEGQGRLPDVADIIHVVKKKLKSHE